MGKFIAIAMVAWGALIALAGPAAAYSAAQGEAMTDPAHADPYTFPRIKPCCGARPDPCANGRCRPPAPRPCWQRASGCQRADDKPYVPPRPRPCGRGDCDHPRDLSLVVRCDGTGEFQTIQEAVDYAESRIRGGTATIYVYGGFPGPACRGPVRITESVSISGAVDGTGMARAMIDAGSGTCVSISGARSVAHLSNLVITSSGGPACVDISGGRVHLANVTIKAENSAAGISARETLLSASGLWVHSGGPAIMARSSSVDISGSSLGVAGGYSFAPWGDFRTKVFNPSQDDRIGLAPLRYLAADGDLDAPYGGGRAPESNPWPGQPGYPANPGYPPQPVNPLPPGGAPGGYPYPYPYPQPGPGYPGAPYPAPGYPPSSGASLITGTPVVALDGSMARLNGVALQGGTHGVTAILSNLYPNLDVTLQNVRITGERGSVGVLALSHGVGWGHTSRVVIGAGTVISGYSTGVEAKGVAAFVNGATVTGSDRGLVIDERTVGAAERNSFTYRGDCRCVGGDCGRGDLSGRFVFRGNACTYD